MPLLPTSPALLIASVPPVTRAFVALTVAFSLLYIWLRHAGYESLPYLVLIPGSSLFYPWTFVTSMFIETSLLELLFSIIVVPPSLRYLERLWGTIETIKFIVVSVFFSNVIAFGLNWIEFIVLRNADLLLYGMQYHGQMALQIAILVAFTQIIPEHQVQILSIFKARVKSLPMAYVTVSTVMCLLGYQCPWIIIQFGWFVSWIYLRFYKKTHGDTVGESYGDRSETFALVSWFPPFAHPVIVPLGNLVHGLASKFHLIPSSSNHDIESGTYTLTPGGARAEAERRRAMALKALDQRVANASPAPGASPNDRQSTTSPRPPPIAASGSRNGDASAAAPAGRSKERSQSVTVEFDADVADEHT